NQRRSAVAATTDCGGVAGGHTLPRAGPPSAPVRTGQLGPLLEHVARPDPVAFEQSIAARPASCSAWASLVRPGAAVPAALNAREARAVAGFRRADPVQLRCRHCLA